MLIYFAFLLSGIGGLIYEVIWIRQFSIIFGSGVYSSSLIAGLFLAGMGAGSWLTGVWSDKRHSPGSLSLLRAYAYLELGIALWGLLAATLFPHLEFLSSSLSWYARTADGWSELSMASHLFRYLVAIVFILPITTAMGGTLPLLIKLLVGERVSTIGSRTGILYALNTLGAAIGCFFVDFSLIPILGLFTSQSLAVVCNLIASLCAFCMLSQGHELTEAARPPSARPSSLTRNTVLIATSMVILGFAAMGMQVLWYRYLVGLLGSYRSVLSILLTVILSSIALGSWTGSFIEKRLKSPHLGLLFSQAAFTTSALICLLFLRGEWANASTYIAMVTTGFHVSFSTAAQYIFLLRIIIAVVAVPAFFSGLAFPLANTVIQHTAEARQAANRVASQSGLLYLANTLGAVLGSVVTAFLALPHFGIQHSMGLLALLAVCGVGLTITAGDTRETRKKFHNAVSVCCLSLMAIAVLCWWLLPANHVTTQVYPEPKPKQGRYLTMKEGVQESVAVMETADGKSRTLWTNGHPMSASTEGAARYMRAFSHIPLLQTTKPKRVLVICFGVGNTLHAAALHKSVHEIEVADLSRNVLEHAHYFSDSNHDVLKDSRVNVFVNDGRQHLRMNAGAGYDLITLEPPPISFAGVSALYSTEFYQLARGRLNQGGYVTQWLPYFEVPEAQVRSIVRAFIDVFPNAVLLGGSLGNFILMGRKGEPNSIDPYQLQKALSQNPSVAADLKAIRMSSLTELVGTFIGSSRSLSAMSENAQPVSDDYPIMEYSVAAFLESAMPQNLVDPRGIENWCPKCFKHGKLIEIVKNLDIYSSLVAALYTASPTFSEVHRSAYSIPRIDQKNARVRETLRDSEYLNQYWPQ